MKKLTLGLLLIIGILTLTGCINYTEETWLNDNGSGKLKMEMAVNEALFNMAQQGKPDADISESSIRKQFAGNKNIKLISAKTFSQYGNKVVQIELEFKSAPSLTAMNDAHTMSSIGFLGEISTRKNKNGQIVFTRILSLNTPGAPAKNENDQFSAMGEQMMAGMLSNYVWKYTMHFPCKVVSANTADDFIDRKKNTVHWEFPLTALAKKPQKMTAVLQPYNFWELLLHKLNLL